jgi:hypothetical protein
MRKPRESLGMGRKNGNHFSFLGYNGKRKKQIYQDTFVFRHNPPTESYINLYLPDNVRKKSSEENNTGAACTTAMKKSEVQKTTSRNTPQNDKPRMVQSHLQSTVASRLEEKKN